MFNALPNLHIIHNCVSAHVSLHRIATYLLRQPVSSRALSLPSALTLSCSVAPAHHAPADSAAFRRLVRWPSPQVPRHHRSAFRHGSDCAHTLEHPNLTSISTRCLALSGSDVPALLAPADSAGFRRLVRWPSCQVPTFASPLRGARRLSPRLQLSPTAAIHLPATSVFVA